MHPRDVWVEVTTMGQPAPRYMLAVDGREVEISEAVELYVNGRIDADELERRIGAALTA